MNKRCFSRHPGCYASQNAIWILTEPNILVQNQTVFNMGNWPDQMKIAQISLRRHQKSLSVWSCTKSPKIFASDTKRERKTLGSLLTPPHFESFYLFFNTTIFSLLMHFSSGCFKAACDTRLPPAACLLLPSLPVNARSWGTTRRGSNQTAEVTGTSRSCRNQGIHAE